MFNLPAQWVAYLRAAAFIIGLIIGPGVPGVQPTPDQKPVSPLQGVASAVLMGGALASAAGEKNKP